MSVTTSNRPAPVVEYATRDRSLFTRIGPPAVILVTLLALFTLAIFDDLTPIPPTGAVTDALLKANAAAALTLFAIMAAEIFRLVRARRAHAAGARLHLRIVRLFAIIAVAPAVLIALVGWVALDRGLNREFLQSVRGFVYNTAEAARLFQESQCRSLLAEARLTSIDVSHARQAWDQNKQIFDEFFESRAKFLGFRQAALVKSTGEVLRLIEPKLDDAAPSPVASARAPATTGAISMPEPTDFDDARKNELQCLVLNDGHTFVALTPVENFDDTFLYAARAIDPFAIEFPLQAQNLIGLFELFNANRVGIQILFATMLMLFTLVAVLTATWLGLSFASRLVTPIRRLIAATDQVAVGNLYVQVPVQKSDGDMASLGETFNKMTSELRIQRDNLVSANRLLDERRLFTEAVLSGVPAGVIGVDAAGRVSAVNPSALRLLASEGEAGGLIGQPVEGLIPELAPLLHSVGASTRLHQGQIAMTRGGRERIFNVRIANEQSAGASHGYVATLDDITDLVSAQRTSAWADVARRIAHEIKNPLTPIQLSAERLKRKYGRLITQDRDVFDQCTDTIVRQVDDIKRMVDEFSSFARMPKARLLEDDIVDCARQVMFLMRVGHPTIDIVEDLPAERMHASFDRRLVSQALTNVIKNATEGIAASDMPAGVAPRIDVAVAQQPNGVITIDVVDNGKGFPVENRSRLLEPYVTSRAEGTGLGLPIVAKIMEDHGGGIELLDAPSGRGAWVRLSFPSRPNVATADSGDSKA